MTGFLVFAGLLALVGLWVVLTNNSFIRSRNKVDESWSGIEWVQLGAVPTSSLTLVEDWQVATPAHVRARRSSPPI